MKSHTLPLMVLALAAGGLHAQDAKPPGHRPPPPVLLKALDGDKDGALSADEIANSSAALLELDKNEDGKLSPREISPPPPKHKGKNPPKGPLVIVKALDLDEDRFLSADEIEDAPASLAVLDKDGDGTISKAELKPGKPPVDPAT
jgi:EF hand